MKKIITLNGTPVELPANQELTILAAAQMAQVDIPTLCSCEDLQVKGNCRVCMVEVWPNAQAAAQGGKGRLMPACSTPAGDGMVVLTHSKAALDYRKGAVELILANHNRSCPSCPGNRQCQLQSLADSLDIVEEDFPSVFEKQPVQHIPGVLKIRRDRCIKCGRCKAYCQQVAGRKAVNSYQRGWETRFEINLPQDPTQLPSCASSGLCDLCGGCTQVCPVGCLTLDTQLDPFWEYIDRDDTQLTAVFCLGGTTVDGAPADLEQKLLEETGCTMQQLAGMLQAVGVGRVLAVTGGPETLASLRTPGQALVAITCDVSWKRLVLAPADSRAVDVVLTPWDMRLMLIQSVLDMDYVQPVEPK